MKKLNSNEVNAILGLHHKAIVVQETVDGIIYLEHEDGRQIKARSPGKTFGDWFVPYEEKLTFEKLGRFLILRMSDGSYSYSSDKQEWKNPFTIGNNYTFKIFCDHLCLVDDQENEMCIFIENRGLTRWIKAFDPKTPFEYEDGVLRLRSGRGSFKNLKPDLTWEPYWSVPSE